MTGSHIIEFHTSKQEEPVTTELLNKVSNVPGLTCKHDAGGGHHNQSDQQSAKPTDYKLNTHENDSFSSDAVGKKVVFKLLLLSKIATKELIEMKLETWILLLYTITTTIVNTVLKANNILGTHVMEENEERFYKCAYNYDMWNSDSYPPKKEMEMGGGGGPYIHQWYLMFSILPKPNITGSKKQELWVKYLHQISRIFTSANVNHEYGTFEANY